MMPLATAAGITAAGAYLNAKFHIRKDVSTLWNLKAGERAFAKNGIPIKSSCTASCERVKLTAC